MGVVTIFRCFGCKRLTTDREIKKQKEKGCPSCGERRVRGASSYSLFEWIKIQLRLI